MTASQDRREGGRTFCLMMMCVTDLSATLRLYCVIFFILKWLTSIVLSENTQRQSNKARQWVIPFFPLIFAVTKCM